MRLRRRTAPALAAALIVLSAAPAGAAAGRATPWAPLSDATGSPLAQAAATLTPDGAIHTLHRQPNAADPSREDVVARRISPDGAIGAPVTIATFDSFDNPNVTLVSSGLLAFLPGLDSPRYGNIAAASAPFAGSPWTLTADDVTESGNYYVNSAGATTDLAGVPYFSGGGSVHRGLDAATPNHSYQDTIGGGCCAYQSDLATDAATGQVWLAWYSNASPQEGVYVHEVDTGSGAPKGSPQRMPGSVTSFGGEIRSSSQFYRTPITGRLGQPGIWLAWPGGYPTQDRLVVWRRGDARSRVLSQGGRAEITAASVTSDPQGRIWAVWGEHRRGRNRIVARRSNPDVSRWGAAVATSPPARTERLHNLTATGGSTGVVGIAAHVAIRGAQAQTWYRQLQPGMTVGLRPSRLQRGRKSTLEVEVEDAGAPVRGAVVRVGGPGGPKATTDGGGTAELVVGPYRRGSVEVRVTAPGYATAERRLRVR